MPFFEVTALLSNYLSPISLKKSQQPPAYFATTTAPKMPISKYLERINKFFQCSEQCYVLAVIYLERISNCVEINQFNIHRLLIISLLVATKFFDDKYYENSYYAKVGGIKNSELNDLEALFLQLINFKLYVTTEDYENCRQTLINACKANSKLFENNE